MKIFPLILLLFICSCATSQVRPPLPSQIYPYSVKIDTLIEKAQFLSQVSAVILPKIDSETQQYLHILSATHYHYMKTLEILVGEGRFAEADIYIESLDKVLTAIAMILKAEQLKQLPPNT